MMIQPRPELAINFEKATRYYMLKLDIFRSIFTWIGIINLVIFILLLHYYNFNIIELEYLTYILSLTFIALGKIDKD